MSFHLFISWLAANNFYASHNTATPWGCSWTKKHEASYPAHVETLLEISAEEAAV
jgi:hypothetical protein